MGVTAVLEVDGQRVSVPDPSGGRCDAAGDFDALLPFDPDRTPLLGRIDAHGELLLTGTDLHRLVAELDLVLVDAAPGLGSRGLSRLRALAGAGAAQVGARLIVTGD